MTERESLCRTCHYTFISREDQVLHYKLDWHLYNVKQKLRAQDPISEQDFCEKCEDDLSSISGSEGEEQEQEQTTSVLLEEDVRLSNAVLAKPLLLFKHKDMFYKSFISLLFGPQDDISDMSLSDKLQDTQLDPNTGLQFTGRVAILLYSAQHFAGAIYENNILLLHKTYHRYTVRAKQGTVQGERDGKGQAPKSFGASLRRYNQIALFNDIEKLLLSWADSLNHCSAIFHRTAVYNRHVLDKLKDKIDDNRNKIRTIPFSTYRPTLKETQRVYNLVTKVSKIFPSAFEEAVNCKVSKELEESSQTRDNSEVIQYNVRSIPNSHLKHKPDKVKKQETSLETVISKPMFHEEPNNVYFKLLASIKSQDLEEFISHLSESPVNLDTALHSGNTLLHIASRSPNPAFISPLLDRGASPEIRNADNKTPYQVAASKGIRDEFRRYMRRCPAQWDYQLAKIPSPLTPQLEEEQERRRQEKKRVQREKQKQRDKVKKEAAMEVKKKEEDKLISQAQDLRKRTLTPRERCLLAAETRLASERSVRGCVSGKCVNCDTGLDGLVPFERLEYKYCSVTCVQEHKDTL